ncbi:hypothetical protein Q5530_21775 [Saccharothrix sp. BKS2]
MVERASWSPDGVDVDLPSSARVHDHLLGGGPDPGTADLCAVVGRKP